MRAGTSVDEFAPSIGRRSRRRGMRRPVDRADERTQLGSRHRRDRRVEPTGHVVAPTRGLGRGHIDRPIEDWMPRRGVVCSHPGRAAGHRIGGDDADRRDGAVPNRPVDGRYGDEDVLLRQHDEHRRVMGAAIPRAPLAGRFATDGGRRHRAQTASRRDHRPERCARPQRGLVGTDPHDVRMEVLLRRRPKTERCGPANRLDHERGPPRLAATQLVTRPRGGDVDADSVHPARLHDRDVTRTFGQRRGRRARGRGAVRGGSATAYGERNDDDPRAALQDDPPPLVRPKIRPFGSRRRGRHNRSRGDRARPRRHRRPGR